MSIYQSDWTPRGVRKEWERCSVGNDDAARILSGGWVKGNVQDACAWFDDQDALRVLVADTDAGKRVTYRRTKRNFTITTEPRP